MKRIIEIDGTIFKKCISGILIASNMSWEAETAIGAFE